MNSAPWNAADYSPRRGEVGSSTLEQPGTLTPPAALVLGVEARSSWPISCINPMPRADADTAPEIHLRGWFSTISTILVLWGIVFAFFAPRVSGPARCQESDSSRDAAPSPITVPTIQPPTTS